MQLISNVAVIGMTLSLAKSVYAHMIMANPVPFGHPNNSPLSPDGSDFPCKIAQGNKYDIIQMNNWKVGERQTLAFTGSAVHGGGSCQLSITLDKEPSKSSKFKVIYSIEGGCPGVNGPNTFPFTVPKEVPNGQYVASWTWLNHIGNREIYMNCAPITVTGGSDDTAAFEKLPDMAVANIAGSNCNTTEGFDYIFENPGQYVTKIGNGPFQPLCGGSTSGGPQPGIPFTAAPSGAPTQNPGVVTPPASQQATSTPSAPASQGPIASNAPSAYASGALVTSTIHTMVTVTAPLARPSAPVTQSSASAAQPSSPVIEPSQTPTAPGGGNSVCSPDGALICNGEAQFGLCDHGKVIFEPVAPGTKCKNGVIAKVKRDFTHRAQRTRI